MGKIKLIFVRILVCFIYVVTTYLVNAEKQCRMPNGNTGECKLLKNCKPLWELNKRFKTEEEIIYLKQSSCGFISSYQFKVCCPAVSQWTKFKEFKPVEFKEITLYETDVKMKSNNINENKNAVEKQSSNKRREVSIWTDLYQNYDASECGQDSSNSNKIIGGEATAIDQYPWLVLLEYDNGVTKCGGSLISTKYVLTAAHCIKGSSGVPKFARLAEYNISSYPTDTVETSGDGYEEITVNIVPIEKNIAHPNYTRHPLVNDIGLSKLEKETVLTDFIKLICLPTRDYLSGLKENHNFTVAGWGSDGRSEFSEVKRHVRVPYVPQKTCNYMSRSISEGHICAGGIKNKDSCTGDSGGPLMYESEEGFIAIGIVSFGITRCGTEGFPGVYTNVYHYTEWIKQYMV